MSDGYCMCGASPLVATDWHARGCPEWRPSNTETTEPPDPPGCVWRGVDPEQGELVALVPGECGLRPQWWDPGEGKWFPTSSRDYVLLIFSTAFLSERARADRLWVTSNGIAVALEGMTRKRDDERAISRTQEERAGAAEATLAAMREGIERVMREMKGGGT